MCSLSPNVSNVKFISRTEVGYAINTLPDSPSLGVTEFWRLNLVDRRPVRVANVKGSVLDFTWSPDGANFAYLVQSDDANQLWMKAGTAAPRVLTPKVPVNGREFISTDEMLVRFSHDGLYLIMVDTIVSPNYFQVWSMPAGKVVWSPPEPSTGLLTMAVWAHLSNRVYYQGGGVRTWNAATNRVGVVASGLGWSSPYLSPDDRLVAYESNGADGKPRVEVRDLVSGSVLVLPGTLGRPTLLSNTVMIGAQLVYTSSPLGPYYWPGRYFVLNLSSRVKTLLPTGFGPSDIWPH